MKTTIKINGLDVEFSEKVPTKAGVYWFTLDKSGNGNPQALSVINPRVWETGDGLWSTSPLVPAVEVEKAWEEGFSTGSNVGSELGDWRTSRARRVTEGGE